MVSSSCENSVASAVRGSQSSFDESQAFAVRLCYDKMTISTGRFLHLQQLLPFSHSDLQLKKWVPDGFQSPSRTKDTEKKTRPRSAGYTDAYMQLFHRLFSNVIGISSRQVHYTSFSLGLD